MSPSRPVRVSMSGELLLMVTGNAVESANSTPLVTCSTTEALLLGSAETLLRSAEMVLAVFSCVSAPGEPSTRRDGDRHLVASTPRPGVTTAQSGIDGSIRVDCLDAEGEAFGDRWQNQSQGRNISGSDLPSAPAEVGSGRQVCSLRNPGDSQDDNLGAIGVLRGGHTQTQRYFPAGESGQTRGAGDCHRAGDWCDLDCLGIVGCKAVRGGQANGQ